MKPGLRCFFVVALALPLRVLDAQEPPRVSLGTRVRVSNDSKARERYGLSTGRVVGTLESLGSSTITVRGDNGESTAVPRLPSTRLDVSAGPGSCSGSRRAGCIVVGFFGGALVGVLAGVAAGGAGDTCEGCGLAFLLTVPAGAVLGTVIGAVVGREHWEAVALPAHVSLVPHGSGRFTLGVSLRF
ncbi:MAG TPA: hypothetical protein VNA31_06780 [bacterium]|nr:hypothetical protein [bacterium]